ncbi:hypothetical protein [Streptomyces sp. NPDC048584]|uniref:hypothetical protein n=1 Tax=Streptomyces sp. NPDC048584 TaxID=3365573 RepID=UPI00371A883A
MTNPLAGLFTARQKESARRDLYARGARLCGAYLATHDTRLTQAIGTLTTALETPAADPFDALLKVGERAVETGEHTLALGIAETSTEIRQRSKGAWRLRARALDGLGRDDEAVESYERHLTLLGDAEPADETTRRIDTLRRRRACLAEASTLFPGDGTPVTAPEFATYVQARVAEHGPADPAVRRLLRLYATHRRLVERSGMPDPLLGGTTPIGVGGLRALLTGRAVCLVSNAAEVAGSGLGADIDGYDLVVRCDTFRINGSGTGERTDLHAVSLRGATPWEGPAWTQQAGVRLVFGDPAGAWRRAVRQRLTAGAQEHTGDASLRRPLSDPALLGEEGWGTKAGTAFTVLRLLDFLDVSPRLDLIGFDKPGRLRPEEAEWVMDRATHVDDSKMRIALR